MNYYSHHIGDFNNATRHLTRVEQSVYRDSIELYYGTETPLTKDFEKLSRRLLCVSDIEKTALLDVLHEFYEETESGWVHDRCENEIAKYRANTSNKAKAGIASALSKKNKTTQINTCSTDVQLTNNQEPITNKELKPIVLFSKSRFEDFWKEYPSSQRKVGKSACEKKWQSKKLNLITEKIIAHIRAVKNSQQWADGFSPSPLTYINQERWNDDVYQDESPLSAELKKLKAEFL